MERIISVCLRIGELAFAAVVAGISGELSRSFATILLVTPTVYISLSLASVMTGMADLLLFKPRRVPPRHPQFVQLVQEALYLHRGACGALDPPGPALAHPLLRRFRTLACRPDYLGGLVHIVWLAGQSSSLLYPLFMVLCSRILDGLWLTLWIWQFIGPMHCGSIWAWGNLAKKSYCEKWKADVAFAFLSAIFWLVSALVVRPPSR
jgi:hypothetical protein